MIKETDLDPKTKELCYRIGMMSITTMRMTQKETNLAEDSYLVVEAWKRYLPDTLRAYGSISASLRHRSHREEATKQIAALHEGSLGRFRSLEQSAQDNLVANGKFLETKFGVTKTPRKSSMFGTIARTENIVLLATEEFSDTELIVLGATALAAVVGIGYLINLHTNKNKKT